MANQTTSGMVSTLLDRTNITGDINRSPGLLACFGGAKASIQARSGGKRPYSVASKSTYPISFCHGANMSFSNMKLDKKKTLLIINHKQFGYHSDTFEIAKYLNAHGWDVAYVCFNQNLEQIESPASIRVIYVPSNGRISKHLKFFFEVFRLARYSNYKHIIYFKFCMIFSLLPNILLDIRTLSVDSNKYRRTLLNKLMYLECMFFNKIVAISEGVARALPRRKNVSVIGLAADTISNQPKSFESFRLLYIGTLTNRNIAATIEGVNLFLDKNPEERNDFIYKIIGSGEKNEVQEVQRLIEFRGLRNNIELLGYMPKSRAVNYFESCNIGVSFVPKKSYYNYQPPTKTFEYLKSGLFTIATSTDANAKIINSANGILIDDTPESFANALSQVHKIRRSLDAERIRDTVAHVDWAGIAKEFEEKYVA
jgi:glycosyltransferase involved in cell wall biosynthesis